jgi:4-amino-4-deoxy-L-arabinose transferase
MKKSLWLFLFFIAALYFLPIAFRPLAAPDEFRLAEIAREMTTSGDLITPKALGIRYFKEPPMAYWLTAASFKLFGFNAFALRLLSVLSVLGSAFLLGVWCRKRNYSAETALNAAFLYLSGLLVWAAGNVAATDTLFAFWSTGVLVCFALAVENTSIKERLLWLSGAGVALAGGFLTKGLWAFLLPAITLIPYLLRQKKWLLLIALPWVPLIISLALIAPWGVAIHRAEPDFWHVFLIHEQLKSCSIASLEQDFTPFWLLLPCFVLGLFPACLPVLTSLGGIRKECWAELKSSPEVRYAGCALLFQLIILILAAGKHPFMLLPCFAPAAMLGAMLMDKSDPELRWNSLRRLTAVTSVIFIVLGSLILLAGLFYLLWGTGFVPSLPLKFAVWAPFLTTAVLGMVIGGTGHFIYRKNKLSEPGSYFSLYAVILAICVWFFPGLTVSQNMPEYELLHIASQLSAQKIRHPHIVAVPQLMFPAAWCFRDSTVQVIASAGELEYGHKYAVARGERPLLLQYDELQSLLRNPKRKGGVLLLCNTKNITEFEKVLPPGKLFSTMGELCGIYYQGLEEKKAKK